jgi:hypothetical protein
MRRLLGPFVVLLLLGLPSAAAAQWETPNRAFHKDTRFPLDGRHLSVPCESCHAKGVYQGTPTTCYACHWIRRQDDRYRTRLGSTCETCHRSTSWTATTWNHTSATGVALNAAHRTLACESCHAGGRFVTASQCIQCHQKDYAATKSPNHQAAGFSIACDGCHKASASTWTSAALNHNALFPLVGLHATVACATCHVNNVFQGTPSDCYSCHKTEYQKTTTPNHLAAQFPTSCDSCHKASDASWTQGRFTHTAFPITSGPHANNACTACHTNPSSYTVFTCLTCHNRTTTDNQHRNRAGYRYDSNACYACHPNGRAG